MQHFNPQGRSCSCGFRIARIASKIEWLEQRPDKYKNQHEGKRFLLKLRALVEKYPQTDVLTPWLWKGAKNGDFTPVVAMGSPLIGLDPEGWDRSNGGSAIRADEIARIGTWFGSKHRKQLGIDIMQLSVMDVRRLVKEWEELLESADQVQAERAESVYQFKDGWYILKLRPEELSREGYEMGHCLQGIDDNDPLCEAIRNGDKEIFSLRDPKGKSHVTIEWVTSTGSGPLGPPQIKQIQGKGDLQPKSEYQARIKEWFQSLESRPQWDSASGGDEHNMVRKILLDAGIDANLAGYGHDLEHGAIPHGDYGTPIPEPKIDWVEVFTLIANEANRSAGRDKAYAALLWQKMYENARRINQLPELGNGLDFLNKPWAKEAQQWMKAKGWISMIDWLVDPHRVPTSGELNLTNEFQREPQDLTIPIGLDQSSPNPMYRNQMRTLQLSHPGRADWEHQQRQSFTRRKAFWAKPSQPSYYRWAFDPEDGNVELSHNYEDHPTKVRLHKDFGPHLTERGYAYRIDGGWRVTDLKHGALSDPFIVSQVLRALKQTTLDNS